MRMYKEIPRNTTRFQGIRRNTTRFQGIQANTNGALNWTEWYANVQRDPKEYNENPRNTKEHCVCSYWNAKEYQKTVCEQGMRTRYANKIWKPPNSSSLQCNIIQRKWCIPSSKKKLVRRADETRWKADRTFIKEKGVSVFQPCSQRNSKEYNEMPMNTKEYNEIPRDTRKYKRNTK